MIRCKQCGIETSDNYSPGRIVCRNCYNANQRQKRKQMTKEERADYRKKNAQWQASWQKRNKEQGYRNALKSKYGITPEQLDEMTLKQKNKCQICNQDGHQGDKRRKLVIDHCHKSGKVRALLCYRCNIMIGYMEKNAELLAEIALYLEHYKVDV